MKLEGILVLIAIMIAFLWITNSFSKEQCFRAGRHIEYKGQIYELQYNFWTKCGFWVQENGNHFITK